MPVIILEEQLRWCEAAAVCLLSSGSILVCRFRVSQRASRRALPWGLRGPLCFPCALTDGSPCAGPLLWGGLDHCWAHSASLLPVSAGPWTEAAPSLLSSSGTLEPPCLWCLGTRYFSYVVHFSWWLRGDLVCARPPEAGHTRHFTERHSEATWLFFVLIVFSLIFDLWPLKGGCYIGLRIVMVRNVGIFSQCLNDWGNLILKILRCF